jgi:membrane fusion protein (multidrug efflux system)
MQITRKTSAAIMAAATMIIAMWSVVRIAGQNTPGQAAAQTPAPPPATVAVVSVVSQSLDRSVVLPGDLVAFQDVEIRPKVSGFIDAIEVDRGSVVKKGQLLVRMVAPELAAQRSEAESKIRSAQSQRIEAEAKLSSDEGTYQRLKKASETPGVVAGNDVEVAQKTVDADRARVELWKQNEQAARDAARSVGDIESYLRVTAPFEGVVTERNVHLGSLVGPSSPIVMLRIQQVSTLRLVVAVPEDTVAGTQPGQMIKFTVPAYPGETFTGRVARLGHALDVKTRTMPVELDVPNPGGKLSPGMFAEVAWTMRRRQPSLFVPPSAVATTTERTFVVRIRNGQTEWVDVRRGAAMKQLVEVFGDLHAGDQVAVRGTDELRAGTRVTPKTAAPSNP